MLADSHVHLDRYPAAVQEEMIGRAAAAGVTRMLNVGADLATSEAAARLAMGYEGVIAAAGVHPKWLHLAGTGALEQIEALVLSGRVAAIGEVGLEYGEGLAEAEAQQRFFAGCLDLATRTGVGISLHIVDAHQDALRLLAQRAPVGAVVHYFQGDAALAGRYLEVGCCISVGKPVTRLENGALRQAIREISLDRLLLETDTYPLPGRTTEPADVADICRAVADLRDVGVDAVAAATSINFCRLFDPTGL